MTERLTDLAAIEAGVWRELEAALRRKDHAWRSGVLATTDGEAADARTVVLRELDVATRTLRLYTDARSAKVAQIAAHPQGTLVLWSPALSWQLRLKLKLEVESSGLAVSSRWARLKMMPAAQDYMSPWPPGSALEQPALERGSRDYFAVVTAQISAIDWLELHADGHRRALFDSRGQRWLAP